MFKRKPKQQPAPPLAPAEPPNPAAELAMFRITKLTFAYEQLELLRRLYTEKEAAQRHDRELRQLAAQGRDAFEPFVRVYQRAVTNAVHRAFVAKGYVNFPREELNKIEEDLAEWMPRLFVESVGQIMPVWEKLKVTGWRPGGETSPDIEKWHYDMVWWLHRVIAALEATKCQVTADVPPEIEKYLESWGLSQLVYWEKMAAKGIEK